MITTRWVDTFSHAKKGWRINRSRQLLETANRFEGAPVDTRKFFFFKEREIICDGFIVLSAMLAHSKSSSIALGFGDGTYDMRHHTLDGQSGWWGVTSHGHIIRNGYISDSTRPLVPGDCVTLVFDQHRQTLLYFLNQTFVCLMSQVMAVQPLVSLGFVSPAEGERCLVRLLDPEEVKIDLGRMRINIALKK